MLRASLFALALGLGLSVLGACGSGGGFIDAPSPPPPPDPGTLAVDWTVTDTAGNPVTCTQVSATTVLINLQDTKSGAAFSATFACGNGGGISGALPASSYNLKFFLLGSAGELASAPPATNVVIQSDMVTHLDPLAFAVF